MNMMIRLIIFLTLPFSICTSSYGLDFQVQSLMRLSGSVSASATSGKQETYSMLGVCPISKTQWFTVLKHSTIVFDSWTEEAIKKAKEAGSHVLNDVKSETLEDEMIPAIVGRSGRILITSDRNIDTRYTPSLGSWPGLYEMEDQKECPYLMLDSAGRKIYCLGYNLGSRLSFDIPLDEVVNGVLGRDKTGSILWVFGSDLEEKPTETPAKDISLDAPMLKSRAIGKIFNFKKGKWTAIQVGSQELLENANRVARTPDGEKVELTLDHMSWLALQGSGFEDRVELLLEAFEKGGDLEKRYIVSGRKHFFKITITKDMVLKAVALRFWMEFGDVSDMAMDEKAGTMKFPRVFMPDREFAFSKKNGGILYYFLAGIQKPNEKMEYPRSKEYEIVKYFVSFPTVNSDAEYLDEYAIRDEVSKQSKSSGGDSKFMMRGLIGKSGDNEYLFDGRCVDKKHNASYCLLNVRID